MGETYRFYQFIIEGRRGPPSRLRGMLLAVVPGAVCVQIEFASEVDELTEAAQRLFEGSSDCHDIPPNAAGSFAVLEAAELVKFAAGILLILCIET